MAHKAAVSINDPVHGAIELSKAELALLDTRPLQRLRSIKQLGLSEYAFPGASHSRFSHSLGAMQMASRMFDRLLHNAPTPPSPAAAARMRQAVRLGTLCHDLGHPPLSHVSERMMPLRKSLQLPPALDALVPDAAAQATHEDYTLKLLVNSPVSDALSAQFAGEGIDGLVLASLMVGAHMGHSQDAFIDGGIDWLPVLHAIISGELDADRMDYLRRDAHNCGVPYGHFDHDFLCAHLVPVEIDGTWILALRHKAVWAFENFLLARYHMFLAVYYHHTSVGFEYLLGRYYASGEYLLPSDSESYLRTDDVDLWATMRQSHDPWAHAVCARKPWALALETHVFDAKDDLDAGLAAIKAAGIDMFVTESRGLLSRYFGRGPMALRVLEPERNRVRSIDTYTPLYERFRHGVQVLRVYCRPADRPKVRALLIPQSPR